MTGSRQPVDRVLIGKTVALMHGATHTLTRDLPLVRHRKLATKRHKNHKKEKRKSRKNSPDIIYGAGVRNDRYRHVESGRQIRALAGW